MTGFTDRTSQGVLAHLVGKTALYTLPTTHVGLFTVVGSDAGTGFTEVSAGGYARVATVGGDWNAPTGSAPSTVANANVIAFPGATADWGTAIAFGLFDALTTGNLLAWDYLGNFIWLPATVNSASPGVITTKAHGFSASDRVVWTNEYGGTLPGFSASNFTGLLTVNSPATDTFTVQNGATVVNTNSTGSGMVRKVASQIIASGVSAAFPAGPLIITSS